MSWRVAAGVLVLLHGLVTVLIWAAPPGEDAPMDTGRSWLLGQSRPAAVTLALVAGALMSVAGVAVLTGQDWWAPLGFVGGVLSLVLFGLFFTPWWLLGIALSIGVVVASV